MVTTLQSSNNLMMSFRHFQSEAKFTDLQIKGKDTSQTFNCHRLVLSAASSYLRSILIQEELEEDQVTVLIPQMGPDILIKFANYIYGGMTTHDDFSQETLSWFKYLGLPISKMVLKQAFKYEEVTTTEMSSEAPVEHAIIEASFAMTPIRFPCPFKNCARYFDARDQVEAHISSEHKLKPKHSTLTHKCPYCESTFATETYLAHHVSTHCKQCGKKFVTVSKLNQHAATHQTENVFVCLAKGCQKSFKMRRYLIQHSKTHEKRGLSCELCEKVLAGPRELRAHLRVHTGEKPYVCRECGTSFRNRSTCNTHMKLHSNKRTHVCPECNHAFIQLGDLRKHMRSKHTNEKPFSCDQCGKRFARSDYLLKHIRAHRKSEQQTTLNDQEDEEDVNALLSEAILDEDVGLSGLETTESIELVLPGPS